MLLSLWFRAVGCFFSRFRSVLLPFYNFGYCNRSFDVVHFGNNSDFHYFNSHFIFFPYFTISFNSLAIVLMVQPGKSSSYPISISSAAFFTGVSNLFRFEYQNTQVKVRLGIHLACERFIDTLRYRLSFVYDFPAFVQDNSSIVVTLSRSTGKASELEPCSEGKGFYALLNHRNTCLISPEYAVKASTASIISLFVYCNDLILWENLLFSGSLAGKLEKLNWHNG